MTILTPLARSCFALGALFAFTVATGCGDDGETDPEPSDPAAPADNGGGDDGTTSDGEPDDSTTETDSTTTEPADGRVECCGLFDCSGEVVCEACGTTVSGCNIRGNDECGFCYTEADCDEVCSMN